MCGRRFRVSGGSGAVRSRNNVRKAQRMGSNLGSRSWVGRPCAIQKEVEEGESFGFDSIRSALSERPIYYRSERWCGTGATGRSNIRLRLSIPTTEMRWSLKDVRRRGGWGGVSFSHLYLSVFKRAFNSGYVLLSNATVCVAFIRYTARVNTSNSSSIPKTYSDIK